MDTVNTYLRENKVAMHTSHFTVGIFPHKLRELLLNFKEELEFAGIYDIDNSAFYIDPKASRYDEVSNRPYSLLDPRNFLVVWHSHPFRSGDKLSFPSIEDLDLVRLNPQTIFLLTTFDGIYVMSATREITSIDSVTKFYRSISRNGEGDCDRWNYDNLKDGFIEGKGDRDIFNIVLIKWKDAKQINKVVLDMCEFPLRKARLHGEGGEKEEENRKRKKYE